MISGFYNGGTNDDSFGWVPKHYDPLTREIAALQQ